MDQFDVEFETYTEEYSAKSFYERYKDNLPQMVMVTQGYLGEVGFETFDRGQVFRIQTYSSQQRAVALIVSGEKGIYGLQGRQISIPVDYDVKCNVIKHGKAKSGKPVSLKEIIYKDLPLDVQFAGSGEQSMVNIGGSERTSSLFTLKLLHAYEDFYLLGNAICYGNLYKTVTAVPAYLPDLRFSIVKSIKGYTEEQYKHFLMVTDNYVKENIQFDPNFGNSDIALYSHDKGQENESFSYITPCEYYNMEDILRNNKPKPTKQNKKEEGGIYEVIRASTISIRSETNHTYDSYNIETRDVRNKSSKEEIEQARKSLKPINIDTQWNGDTQGDSKSEKTGKEDGKQLTKGRSEEEADMKRFPPPIPTKPDQSVKKGKQLSESNVLSESKGPPIPKRNSIIPQEIEKETVPGNASKGRDKIGSANVGRALPLPVKPVEPVTEYPGTQQPMTSSLQSCKSGEADIVVDVKSLNMEDVSDWMKKLKLEKYADLFLENQVDGFLLMQLDKQMLKDDFGMRDFDIMKLMTFAKSGHVPKSRGGDL